MDIVQFDTTKNHFLAAGDEYLIKFWDMDNTTLLTTVDADGGLAVWFVIVAYIFFFDVNYLHSSKERLSG